MDRNPTAIAAATPRTLRRRSVPGTPSRVQDGPRTHLQDAGPRSPVHPRLPKFLCHNSSHLRHPDGLAMFERAIPWVDLATFLSRGPRVSSNYTQSDKLSKSSILPEDWAMRGMVWPGRLFERGFWDGGENQLMEMEMLDARNPLPETLDEDGMWEDDLNGNDMPSREMPSRAAHHVGLDEDCQGSLWVPLGR